jgi:hypothetical protein
MGNYRGFDIIRKGGKTYLRPPADVSSHDIETGPSLRGIEFTVRELNDSIAKDEQSKIDKLKNIEQLKVEIAKPFAKTEELAKLETRAKELETALRSNDQGGEASAETAHVGDRVSVGGRPGEFVGLGDRLTPAGDRGGTGYAVVRFDDGTEEEVEFEDIKKLARIANEVEDESGTLDLSQPAVESVTASPAPADVAPAPAPAPAVVVPSPAAEPAPAPEPAPVVHPPVTVKKLDTKKGVRYVHGFKPNESLWQIWKRNKPSYLTVYKNKHSGVWEASVWGANEQEVQDNMADLRKRGLKYERPDYPLRYQMDDDQPEEGEDHYHALATMYAEMWNGLEQAGMEPTDRGIWKASEELADGEWVLYHDPADKVWKVVQAEQAPKVFRYGKLEYATPPRMFVYRCPYCGGLAYQGDPVQGGVFQAYALCSRCGRGFSILGRDSVEQPRLSYSRVIRYAAHRVPKGYIVNKGGKIYRAGKWVSEADLRTATPVSGAQPAAASASPKGKRVVNRQSLSEKLAPHAGHVLTPEEIKTAKTRFNALSGHHKELVHHRIEELANSTHAALQEAKDPAARKLLSKQMRVYQEMLAWGDAKAKAIEDAKPYAEKVKEKAAKAAPYTAAVKDKRANAKKGAYEGKVAEKRAVAKAKPKPEPKKETSYADKVASKAKPTASYADTVASRRRKKDPEADAGDREAFNVVNEHEEPAAEPERDKPISTRDIPEPWGGANEPIQEPESYVEKVKAKTVRKSKDDGEDYFALPPKRRPSKFDAATEDLGGKTYAEVIAEKMKKAGATS